MSSAYAVSLACRVLVGTVFAVSVLSKVHSRSAWRSYSSWLQGVPLGPLRAKGAPAAVATAEAAVAVLVAVPDAAAAGLVAGAAACLALTLGLAVAYRRGSREPCHCFGSSAEPLSGLHVARNGLLLALAILGSAFAVGTGSGSVPWAEFAVTVIAGLAAALVVLFFGDIAALVTPMTPVYPGARGGRARRES